MENPEGYEIPVHRSLTEPVLMGGVPRKFGIMLGTITAALAMGLSSLWVLPFSLAAYLGMVSACKIDPEIEQVFIEHWNQPSELEV